MPDAALVAVRDDLLSRLDGLPGLRAKAMFGCYGVYAEDDLFFAIVGDGRVFFRTDERTRPEYVARGGGPFPFGPGDAGSRSYYSVPPEVLADPAELLRWTEDALDAARRVRTAKRR